MSGWLSTADLSVQDRVFAVLRDHEEPLTTDQVCVLAGPVIVARSCNPWRHHVAESSPDNPLWTMLECRSEEGVDIVAQHLGVERKGFHMLSRLESLGLARSSGWPRAVTWIATVRALDREILELETQWREEAGS